MSLDIKKRLINSLNTLPDSLSIFESVTLPDVSSIAPPTSEAESIMADGLLSAALLSWMSVFSGLPILEFFLHVGERDQTQQAALLSRLEALRDGSLHTVEIVLPSSLTHIVSGEELVSYHIRMTEGAADYASAIIEIDGTPHTFSHDGSDLTGQKLLSIGSHNIYAEITFLPDFHVSSALDFEVVTP
jgi:hypothetical protein